jgi:hypothetical protein
MNSIDDQIMMQFRHEQLWALGTAIDLYRCDPELIADPDAIRAFSAELCERIGIEAQGKPILIRCSDEPRARGYVVLQLAEQAIVSGHFVEVGSAAYLDIRSCQPYPPYRSATFCKEFFRAGELQVSITFRYAASEDESALLQRVMC